MFNVGNTVYVKDGLVRAGFVALCSHCKILAIKDKLVILETQHHGDIVKMIHEIDLWTPPLKGVIT